MTLDVTRPFQIEDFHVDPDGLKITGPGGDISLEPKIMAVLLRLVEKAGETVLREDFMEHIWGVEFGSDESLTRAISVLRKIFRGNRGRRVIIETVPRKGYRLIADVSDQRRNVIDCEAVTVPSNDATSQSSFIAAPPTRISVISGIVASILIFAAVYRVNLNAPEQVTETESRILNSVSVEPFVATGGDKASKNLANSITSQIAAVLTEQGIATTFGASSQTRSEFILSGNVWTLNGEPQATLRLKETQSGLIIWSEIMDRSDNAAPDYGFGVAVRVGSVLSCLASWRTPDYVNPAENLQLYARYCAITMAQGFMDIASLTEPIYRAEPDNPVVMALHANSLWPRRNDQASTSRDLRQEADNLVNEALALAPESDRVRALWALNRQFNVNDADADRILADVTSSPGLPEVIYSGYGAILRRTGRIKDATALQERLVRSSPNNASALARLGWLYATQGGVRQPERYFNLAENIDPDAPELIIRRRQIALWLGDDNALRAVLENWPIVATKDTLQLERCLKVYAEEKLSGTPDIARVMESRPGNEPVWLARMLVGLGDVDHAYAVIEGHDWTIYRGSMIHLFYPDMAPFRADPRFWKLVEEIGLVDYWRSTRHWPDFCLTEDHPGFCPLDETQNISATR